MKLMILILAIFVTGCSTTTSKAYFNMVMANVAPGSWDVAVYNGGEIVQTMRSWDR